MPATISHFKRSPLLSLRFLVLLYLTGLAGTVYVKISKGAPPLLTGLYLTPYVLAVLVLVSYQGRRFDYFGVSDKALIIRNSFFRWQYREIPLSSIESVRIDSDSLGRWQSACYLMVFLGKQKKQRFYGAALNRKQWTRLAEELEKYEVRVVNQYPYIPFKDLL